MDTLQEIRKIFNKTGVKQVMKFSRTTIAVSALALIIGDVAVEETLRLRDDIYEGKTPDYSIISINPKDHSSTTTNVPGQEYAIKSSRNLFTGKEEAPCIVEFYYQEPSDRLSITYDCNRTCSEIRRDLNFHGCEMSLNGEKEDVQPLRFEIQAEGILHYAFKKQ